VSPQDARQPMILQPRRLCIKGPQVTGSTQTLIRPIATASISSMVTGPYRPPVPLPNWWQQLYRVAAMAILTKASSVMRVQPMAVPPALPTVSLSLAPRAIRSPPVSVVMALKIPVSSVMTAMTSTATVARLHVKQPPLLQPPLQPRLQPRLPRVAVVPAIVMCILKVALSSFQIARIRLIQETRSSRIGETQ